MRRFFVNDLNLKKQAKELGVKVWQTPGFLFIVLGIVAATIMLATYLISRSYDSPSVLVISESLVAIVVLSVGSSVINSFEQIASVNKMKSEFVSVVSHQLRTPLSAIKWNVELILGKNKKGLSEKQIKKVEEVSFLTHKMTRLVNDLLDVTRIEQNRMIFRNKKFDLKEAIKEVLEEVAASAQKRNIHISATFEKKLPLAFADSEKIKLVVENLVSNAIKYTPTGGRIEVSLKKKGKQFIFNVKDDGVGIPREQEDRVFEKFFRSDNAARYQTEGTGLGLYIAKNIVEQSGGKIWFQSIEDVGSVFSFSIPIAEAVPASLKVASKKLSF